MEGEYLSKGGDGMEVCGIGGHQAGVDADACEESIEIERGGIGRGVMGVLVVVVVKFTFSRSQGLIRLKGEVCPEVEVCRKVGEGGGEVLRVLLDGVDDVETTQIQGRHGRREIRLSY